MNYSKIVSKISLLLFSFILRRAAFIRILKSLIFTGIALTSASLISCAQSSPGNRDSGETNSSTLNNSGEIQGVLHEFQLRLDSVRSAIDSNDLNKIHGQAENLIHCKKAIGGLYSSKNAWERNKVKSYLHDIDLSLYWLHQYADSRDRAASNKIFNSLKLEFEALQNFLAPRIK